MRHAILIWCLILLCSFTGGVEKTIWLSDLDLSLFDLETGQAMKNKTSRGDTIIISGVHFENGVGVGVPSKYLIELNGTGMRFYAEVGACDRKFRARPTGTAPAPAANSADKKPEGVPGEGAPGGMPGGMPGGGMGMPGGAPRMMPTMEFYVLGDKKIIWQSGEMKTGDKAKTVDVDLTGIKKLALVIVSITSAGPFGSMAAWGNAKITYLGDNAPKALPSKTVSGSETKILTPSESDQPKINYPKVVGATPGKPFIFSLPVTGKKPLLVTVDKLPKGLILDGNTGIITGTTPSEKGTYPLNITVKNSHGTVKGKIDLKVGDLLALTPPMGWNSWNAGGMSVDQVKIRSAVDVISDKLRGHGWLFVNIDDGWQADKRNDKGELLTNQKFSDIKGMSDYIHSKGLRFGIYSSPGPRTCGQALGSYEHELQDAIIWGNWGIDYLKYDWCSYGNVIKTSSLDEFKKPYKIMQEALVKTNRDIVYSLCQYGMGDVWKWGPEVNGNLWRTTGDIQDNWRSILTTGFTQTNNADYVNPGHWNDPDMLVIGSVGWSANTLPTKLTRDEQYSHVSLWSLLSSPLLIGCDMTKLDDFTLGLVTNDEVIGINQDILGKQAKLIIKSDDYQVWAKDLSDGSKVVGLFYTGGAQTVEKDPAKMINWGDGPKSDTAKLITIDFSTLGISGKQIARNLWSQKDIGSFEGKLEATVNYHGVALVKLSAAK